MDNKDITHLEQHNNFRKKLWCDVYVAYVASSNSVDKNGASIWADTALQRFDEKFFNLNKPQS